MSPAVSVSALQHRLTDLRDHGRPALVAYLTAGYPDVETSKAAIRVLAEAGADAIEVGLPYSDPVMDGPTVQAAAQGALSAGTRITDVFAVTEQAALTGTPTVVMTYWNPVERYGVERFATELSAAGGAGLITPDLIPEEAAEWMASSSAHGLDRIFLVAPSSTAAPNAST